MNFRNLFSRTTPTPATAVSETKESQVAKVIWMNEGQAAYVGNDYRDLSREGYMENVIAYACVTKIAEAVSSVAWTAWKGEKELSDSPFLHLIKNPNPDQSYSDFIMQKVSYKLIQGNNYDEKVSVIEGGEPRELYTLRPDRVEIFPAVAGGVAKYVYRGDTNQAIEFPVAIDGSSAILHSKLFNPLNDFYGFSPMQAAIRGLSVHNESFNWMQKLLQNSARPSLPPLISTTSGTPSLASTGSALKRSSELARRPSV